MARTMIRPATRLRTPTTARTSPTIRMREDKALKRTFWSGLNSYSRGETEDIELTPPAGKPVRRLPEQHAPRSGLGQPAASQVGVRKDLASCRCGSLPLCLSVFAAYSLKITDLGQGSIFRLQE